MAMQTDVKSVRRTDDGQIVNARARVKAVYGLAGAGVGSVQFHDGTSTAGEIRLYMDTPAGTANTFFMLLPGEGILFETGVYVNVTDITSVTVVYG